MAAQTLSRKRKTPEWLRPLWERRNAETDSRISAGLEKVLKQNQPTTLARIQQAILAQSGVRISLSTIQRSEAYRHRRRRTVPGRPAPVLEAVLQDLGPQDRKRLLAKASRLRRDNKETLISRILILERAISRQADVERALQQEILRLQLEPTHQHVTGPRPQRVAIFSGTSGLA
jgi:hypothetical protein